MEERGLEEKQEAIKMGGIRGREGKKSQMEEVQEEKMNWDEEKEKGKEEKEKN